ncbi:hypothetical protein SAMN04488508_105339 [Aquimarina spongiae]|uniref:Uncharacterized protein n=1 Tax=Aquimarina spongiae TaxID=570521 RepID=A0A1M6GLF8_9FLAO|nr:hypothetical protein SAMN04488508_105339 [Aquimarina spongiae]
MKKNSGKYFQNLNPQKVVKLVVPLFIASFIVMCIYFLIIFETVVG